MTLIYGPHPHRYPNFTRDFPDCVLVGDDNPLTIHSEATVVYAVTRFLTHAQFRTARRLYGKRLHTVRNLGQLREAMLKDGTR